MRPFHRRLFRERLRNEEHHNAPVSPVILLIIKFKKLRLEGHAARKGEMT
jgi:hypothetical protein